MKYFKNGIMFVVGMIAALAGILLCLTIGRVLGTALGEILFGVYEITH